MKIRRQLCRKYARNIGGAVRLSRSDAEDEGHKATIQGTFVCLLLEAQFLPYSLYYLRQVEQGICKVVLANGIQFSIQILFHTHDVDTFLFPCEFHLKAERFILCSCSQLRLALLIFVLTHILAIS